MTLRQTAFHSRTSALGASFVEYADYDFPARYGLDINKEYFACRQRAVVIDLTPLRKVEVTGPGAEALLQHCVTRDVKRLGDGDVVYTALCDENGNVVDDGTVFRFGPERFRWVGYTDEDEGWFRERADRLGLEVGLENSTDRLHNLAVQGPLSREIVSQVVSTAAGRPKVTDLTWFRFTEGGIGEDGPHVLASRTGYSGELGYELWCDPVDGSTVWDAVWAAGEPHGIAPLGLDALDLVRVDAGLIFKGYEYEGEEDPFEAGIGFTVPRDKTDDYVGKEALARRRENPTRALVGLEVEGTEAVAHGDEVLSGPGGAVGIVTSGTYSPGLEKNLALARVAVSASRIGSTLAVRPAAGGGDLGAKVVRFPFYDPDKTRPRS
jgi:aminomethyltransferase